VSRNKLRVSTNFIIFGPMDQKLWVFEFLEKFGRESDCLSQGERVRLNKFLSYGPH
jgi:hypothetical protein